MLRPPHRFIPPLGPPKRSARQRALATLRGIDLRPLEKIRERPATAIGSWMPAVLSKLRIDQHDIRLDLA